MQIAGFAQERGACTVLRIAQPLNKIKSLNLAGTYLIGLADPNTEKAVQESDVVVMGRAASEMVLGLVRKMQSWGKKIVFDLDDNMFDVSVMSPHYAQLGSMPVDATQPDGTKAPVWKDGTFGFDVKRNRGLRKSFINLVRAADCVTVTTPPLAKIYKRFNDNVRVVPNSIDFAVWEKPPVRWDKDEIRLLYTGAANHQEDWLFVAPVLRKLQEKYPQLTIVLIGTDWKQVGPILDYSRVEVAPWVDFEAYPYVMKNLCCDIGIAPVSKTSFNDCRSSLKWVEYSALKMATVATNYGPYARDCEDGTTALLVREKNEWFDALCKLIENETLRKEIANNAFKKCRKDFNLDYMVDTWMTVFNDLKGRN